MWMKPFTLEDHHRAVTLTAWVRTWWQCAKRPRTAQLTVCVTRRLVHFRRDVDMKASGRFDRRKCPGKLGKLHCPRMVSIGFVEVPTRQVPTDRTKHNSKRRILAILELFWDIIGAVIAP